MLLFKPGGRVKQDGDRAGGRILDDLLLAGVGSASDLWRGSSRCSGVVAALSSETERPDKRMVP